MIRLTRAQARSLAAVAITGSRTDAALALGVSRNTLDAHLTACFALLSATSVTEACRRIGWLDIPAELLDLPVPERSSAVIWIRGVE